MKAHILVTAPLKKKDIAHVAVKPVIINTK